MKKILAFVAIAAASAALFAADPTTKGFKLKTKVAEKAPVFHLYQGETPVDGKTFTDGDDGVVINLLKDGSFTGVDVGFEAGANFAKSTSYTVTAEDTDFYVVGDTAKTPKLATTVNVGGANGATGNKSQDFLAYYKGVTKLDNSAIEVSWTGDSTLAAASYQDDVTVTIAVNN